MSPLAIVLALAAAPLQQAVAPPRVVVVVATARAEIIVLEPVAPPRPGSTEPQLQRQVSRTRATIEFY